MLGKLNANITLMISGAKEYVKRQKHRSANFLISHDKKSEILSKDESRNK